MAAVVIGDLSHAPGAASLGLAAYAIACVPGVPNPVIAEVVLRWGR